MGADFFAFGNKEKCEKIILYVCMGNLMLMKLIFSIIYIDLFCHEN